MVFNPHRKFEGMHAFLGASKYHWLNYEDDKLIDSWRKASATQEGTELHAIAAQLIKKRLELKGYSKTLSMFVNDAIGFRMTPEQVLYYSDNCFGTADAIYYGKNTLRIHDLKTGETPASMHQLEIYAALFFLEYNIKPENTKTILRIYQSNDIIEGEPSPELIREVMDKIIHADSIINELKEENSL